MFGILRHKKECLNTPGDFKESWNNTDELYKKKWREAIIKEVDNMERVY